MVPQKGKGKGGSTALTRALSNLNGELKNSFLSNYPHHTVPGLNLNIHSDVENYDEDNIEQLFKPFPYDYSLPRPLLPPARLPECVLKNQDPALELLSIKAEIKDNVSRITEYHEKYRRDLTPCHKKYVQWKKNDDNTGQTTLPRYVAELAEIIESDPDPQFKGEYNWYYTGGALRHLSLSDRTLLLFPYAKELVVAPIVEKRKSLWKPNLKDAGKCDLGDTLYETRCAITSSGMYRILGRQKYSCNFYSLIEDQDKFELQEIAKQSSDSPYISADLSQTKSNKYCVAKSKSLVEIWDFNRQKCLSSISMPKSRNLSDDWMTVEFDQSDPNLIAIVNRCCLHQIDLRTPFDGPNLTLCPKDNLEICENLSLTAASKHNTFFQYLGTYHSLLLCDSRFGNSSVVQKWTHQFKSPPIFCAINQRANEEIVTLSSQLSGENSVILNTWTSDARMYSYSLPSMPPSISETLRACQDKGKCLDPSLRGRLELCNAGTALNLSETNHATFFTQNSIGDIFYQCLTYEKMLDNISEINKKSLVALDAWEEAYLKQSKTVKPLALSENVNMKHVWSGMQNANLRLESGESQARYPQLKWYQSLEILSSYVDILAPELLAVWDVKENTISSTMSPHQKVLSWLEKKMPSQNERQSQTLTQTQDDSLIINDDTEIFSQELISVSQNIQPNNDAIDNTLIERNICNAPAVEKRHKKKTAKKNKYIAGF